MPTPIPVDLRLDPQWIIPVEPALQVLEAHALIVRDGRILDILPDHEADSRYQPAEQRRLPGHAIIPGLINLHTHAAMALLRGYADDRALMDWLQNHIWPTEKRWLSPDFVADGTRLACLEMLEGGITCFNDMYFFPEASIEVAIEARQRISSGLIVLDFPTAWAADTDAYLQQGLALRDRWREHPLVNFCLAPHAPYSVSDRSFEKVATYSDQLDLPIHCHCHETLDEIQQSLQQHGVRPLERLRRLGLLGPQFIAVHAVHLSNEEQAMLAEQGVSVAHCPSSNLKLASGIAPITALHAHSINIGLGSDGAASNNRLDLWQEMRLTALLAKGASGQADALPAYQALAMATINGARALGMDTQIGSLVVGKQADLVAVDLSGPENQPCFDPIAQLVYSAGREHVSAVWIAGQPVVTGHRCQTLDRDAILARSHYWRERLQRH
jgi:5-methylthioadenosine/S-adenosylhomocysteine deaminase